ncbi:MAG TPA: hypothetical protein VIK80_05610 [Flavihumibacter sp.]
MNRVKLQFSEEETALVSDPAIILTKNRILGKLSEMLGSLSEVQREQAESYRHSLPSAFFEQAPKISRGDNYQGLPWLMLDFPRCFTPGKTLAIRQFFWWGRFFSSTLLVSGPLKASVLAQLESGFPVKKEAATDQQDLYICVHASPWEHHFQEDNFKLVREISNEDLAAIGQREFLKLAYWSPIGDWAMVPDFFNQSFLRWMQLLVRANTPEG